MHWMDHGWGMAGGMWLFWLLVLLLIVGLVVWIARQSGSRGAARTSGTSGTEGTGARTGAGPVPPVEDSAEEMLRKRYARGDIEREEFEERMRDLRRS